MTASSAWSRTCARLARALLRHTHFCRLSSTNSNFCNHASHVSQVPCSCRQRPLMHWPSAVSCSSALRGCKQRQPWVAIRYGPQLHRGAALSCRYMNDVQLCTIVAQQSCATADWLRDEMHVPFRDSLM